MTRHPGSFGALQPEVGATVLSAQRVSKTFPGVIALDDVSFTVAAGEVNALVGETARANRHS